MLHARPTVSPRRRPAVLTALGLGALALLGATWTPAGAQSARDERARVQQQQAGVASEVDALQADQAAIAARLEQIGAEVQAGEQAAAEARRIAAASAEEAANAQRAAAASAEEVAILRERLRLLAVSVYVDPPGEDLVRRFQATTAQEDATRRAFMEVRTGRDTDVVDQLRVVQRRHEDDVRRAEATRTAAEAAQAQAQATVASLQASQGEQQAFAEQVRARLDQRLSDAAALERLDADLARRIREEEAAIAAALAARVPAPSPPAPAGGGGGGSSGGGGGGGGGGGSSPQPTTPPPAGPRPSAPPLRTVGGITVHRDIADQLGALLQAAAADGIVLGGSGYRDISSQIALRRQNCGTSDYAVYDMPPDQCSPPTARPGASMHERGLAIDFTANGRFINSRSDPGFVWLAANAGRFGFYNLPSEPWHWSTTGG